MSNAFAVDLDGCVTSWSKGFSTLCNEINPTAPIIEHGEAQAWRWQRWYAPELSRRAAERVIELAWRQVKLSRDFWLNLEPLFPETMGLLAEMSDTQPLIFITRRDGIDPWNQTVTWLRKQGIREPLVYCVKGGEEKSEVMDKLGLQLIIEDSPKYVTEDLIPAGKSVVLIDWQYNRGITGEKLLRVPDLATALEVGRNMYQWN